MTWRYCLECAQKTWVSKSAAATCRCGAKLCDAPPPVPVSVPEAVAIAARLPLLEYDDVTCHAMPADAAELLTRRGSGRRVHVVGYESDGRLVAELRSKHGRDCVYMAILTSGVGSLFVDAVGKTISPAQAPEWAARRPPPRLGAPDRETWRKIHAICTGCDQWGTHPCVDGQQRSGCGLLSKPCRIEVLQQHPLGDCPLGKWSEHSGLIGPFALQDEDIPPRTSDRCVLVIAVGDQAREIHAITHRSQQAYAQKCGADYRVLLLDYYPTWPLANKWRAFYFASAYERTLVLDTDVAIRLDAPDVFEATPADRFCVIDEFPIQRPTMGTEWIRRESIDVARSQMLADQSPIDWEPNAGVMIIPRSLAHAYIPPTYAQPYYWCTEQHWLALRMRELGITPHLLDRRFNWTHTAPDFEAGLADAWFVHFNAVPHFDRIAKLRDFFSAERQQASV